MRASMLAFQLIASSAASLGVSASATNSASGGSTSCAGLLPQPHWHAQPPRPQQRGAMAGTLGARGYYGDCADAACCAEGCREATPPPGARPADAASCGGCGCGCAAGDDASPLSSGTPLQWAAPSCTIEELPHSTAAAAPAPRQRRAAPAAAAAAAAALRGKRARPEDAPGALSGEEASWAAWAAPARRPRVEEQLAYFYQQRRQEELQQQQQQEQQRARTAWAGGWEPELQAQRSDGSSGSLCSSATAAGRVGSAEAQLAAAAEQLVRLRARLQQQQRQQQQQQQQQQHAHALIQQQQAPAGRLSAARTAAPGPAPGRRLLTDLDAGLAWAGGVLGAESREVFLLGRHIWARAGGRLDELLVASLGAATPPPRVGLLVALWLASKLEGHRRQVAGAGRLAAATGLSRWGVAAVEVHILQLVDFSPYRGW